MRFIGNKEKIIENIHKIMKLNKVTGDSFFDFFSGTSNVAKYFKKLDYKTYSSDILYFSYVLQRAYIQNNKSLDFKKLLKKINPSSSKLFSTPLKLVISHLNGITPVQGFVCKNYCPAATSELEKPRMYFTDENGAIIDGIRQEIEKWHEKKDITENEYYVLIACLIETVPFYSNITGVYGAFQKKWDVRAVKKITLRPVELVTNNKENESFNANSVEIMNEIEADIFYLDPPYNQRQYAPNYHVLETIAKYDSPIVKGVTGLRDYKEQKSNFCNPGRGLEELGFIAKNSKCKFLVLSYNNEGIMPKEKIMLTLEKFGSVKLVEFEYARFKSNNNGLNSAKKHIKEQLYILKKKK